MRLFGIASNERVRSCLVGLLLGLSGKLQLGIIKIQSDRRLIITPTEVLAKSCASALNESRYGDRLYIMNISINWSIQSFCKVVLAGFLIVPPSTHYYLSALCNGVTLGKLCRPSTSSLSTRRRAHLWFRFRGRTGKIFVIHIVSRVRRREAEGGSSPRLKFRKLYYFNSGVPWLPTHPMLLTYLWKARSHLARMHDTQAVFFVITFVLAIFSPERLSFPTKCTLAGDTREESGDCPGAREWITRCCCTLHRVDRRKAAGGTIHDRA